MPTRNLHCSLSYFSIDAVYKGDAGKHMEQVDPAAMATLSIDLFALSVLTTLALTLPKLSFLGVYFRILFKKSHRLAVWVLAALISGNAVATLLINFFMCSPISKVWNPSTPGHCIETYSFGIYGNVNKLVTDIMLTLLPIPMIAKLQVNRSQKLRLYFMFSLGAM